MFHNIYKNKKVLITGHTGFKGSWLVTWLQMLGANVSGISLPPNTNPAHFSLLNLSMDSHIANICDYEKIDQLLQKINPEIIFHLAAQPLVRESYKNPLETFNTNVIGTANILNACRNLKNLKAVVTVTTDKCYENKEWIWGYRENDPMGGYDPYSASKGCAELVINSLRNSYFNLDNFNKTHQILLASARAGNVIGGGDWAEDRLIPDIIKATTSNETVIIRNPHSTRPWQHVLECLSGYLCIGEKLLQGDKKFAEAWNFAPTMEANATVIDIVQKMQCNWPKIQYKIEQNPNQPHEANLLKLDSSKAHALLNWRNVWNLEETVTNTTNWYRNFYEKNLVTTLDNINNYVKTAEKLGLIWTK